MGYALDWAYALDRPLSRTFRPLIEQKKVAKPKKAKAGKKKGKKGRK